MLLLLLLLPLLMWLLSPMPAVHGHKILEIENVQRFSKMMLIFQFLMTRDFAREKIVTISFPGLCFTCIII
jgi:hypothetical protein